MKWLSFLIFCCSMVGCSSYSEYNSQDSIAVVLNGYSSGSCVLVSDTKALTSLHIFNRSDIGFVSPTDTKLVFHDFLYNVTDVEPVGYDSDLAILTLECRPKGMYPAQISWEVTDSPIEGYGYNMFVVQNTQAACIRYFTNKIVEFDRYMNMYGFDRDYDTWLDEIPSPGNSGGGIFQDGKVIGVITACDVVIIPYRGYFVPLYLYRDRIEEMLQ